MSEETVTLNEFKCIDCDQVFLMANRNAKYCPRCGSNGTQYGAVVTVTINGSQLNQ